MSTYSVVSEDYDVYLFGSQQRLKDFFDGEGVYNEDGKIISKNFLRLAFSGQTTVLYLYEKNFHGEIIPSWAYKVEKHG